MRCCRCDVILKGYFRYDTSAGSHVSTGSWRNFLQKRHLFIGAIQPGGNIFNWTEQKHLEVHIFLSASLWLYTTVLQTFGSGIHLTISNSDDFVLSSLLWIRLVFSNNSNTRKDVVLWAGKFCLFCCKIHFCR
mmetsp:Transcript_114758/g.329607  ORF Transcript_114758/g.329607 Transcript_114758/m.329607 type:complete len:133 (+) Transcript_114758:1466-1864(+)